MKLNRHLRKALITELNNANEEFKLGAETASKTVTKDYQAWTDIKMYLTIERIDLIEKALISNNINF